MPDDDRITLRDHFQSQLEWVDRYFAKQLETSHLAIEKAEQQLNARLSGMNEFRETLKDQASKLATKDEVNLLTDGLEKRVQALERNEASGEGRTKATGIYWSIGASILTALIVLLLSKLVIK